MLLWLFRKTVVTELEFDLLEQEFSDWENVQAFLQNGFQRLVVEI
jgi:hypothetical protein